MSISKFAAISFIASHGALAEDPVVKDAVKAYCGARTPSLLKDQKYADVWKAIGDQVNPPQASDNGMQRIACPVFCGQSTEDRVKQIQGYFDDHCEGQKPSLKNIPTCLSSDSDPNSTGSNTSDPNSDGSNTSDPNSDGTSNNGDDGADDGAGATENSNDDTAGVDYDWNKDSDAPCGKDYKACADGDCGKGNTLWLEWLANENVVRCQFGVSPVKWSEPLFDQLKKTRTGKGFKHTAQADQPDNFNVGENLSSSKEPKLSTEMWGSESTTPSEGYNHLTAMAWKPVTRFAAFTDTDDNSTGWYEVPKNGTQPNMMEGGKLKKGNFSSKKVNSLEDCVKFVGKCGKTEKLKPSAGLKVCANAETSNGKSPCPADSRSLSEPIMHIIV